MKILVVQQKMIGDVLISTIICNNLRNAYPGAQIDYLIYPFTKPVVENNPNISKIILFDDKIKKSKWHFLKFAMSIRKEKYDIVIDAYGKIESCLIALFSGAKTRVGYAQKEKFFAYNKGVSHHKTPKTTAGLAIERRVNLFSDLMLNHEVDSHPKLFITAEEKDVAKELFLKHQIDINQQSIIMVSILGSEENKTYPEHYLALLLDRIALQPNITLLFNYMPKQFEQAKSIYDLCSNETKSKINLEIIGADLRSFMGIMSHCKVLIGNDGGAVNMAKAMNKPTFTIFSPWIQKESWSIFEDGYINQAVHLNDFSPELILENSRKNLKKNYLQFYNLLKPELFLDKLESFLKSHISSKNV